MKYLMLMFMLLVSISAYTANQAKNNQAGNMNTPTAKPANEQATQLDDLVRGELAALKAYDAAMKDLKDENQKAKLEKIRNDHEKAVSMLSKYVAGKPELLEDTKDSGAWGTFAKNWAKVRGVDGLRQGEQHGIDEYEEALEDENLPKNLKAQIKNELLPNQKKHIETLKTL